MSELRYAFDGDCLNSQEMNAFVRTRLGNMCYVSRMPEGFESQIVVGAWDDEIVIDSETSTPRLHMVPRPDMFRGFFEETEYGVVAVFPSRAEIIEEMNTSRSRMTESSESSVLESIGSKILKVPSVANQMNPIMVILDSVLNASSISTADFKNTGNLMKYLEFLNDLEIIKMENGQVCPGRRMRDMDPDMDDDALYSSLLGTIVGKGYTRMFTDLHMTHLRPYIRMTNTNCMTSLLEDKPLKWDWRIYGRYLRSIYQERLKKTNIITNAAQLRRAGVMASEMGSTGDAMFFCKDDVFSAYSERFKSLSAPI